MTELSNWGRWGKDDQIGTLNLITAEKRKQALRLASDGVSVSLAHTLDKEQFPDNPRPLGQQMTLDAGGHAMDLYTIWYHGSTITHIDALCHYSFDGKIYNGFARSAIAQGPPGTAVYASDLEAWEKFAGVKIGSGDALFLRTGR